jgi:uncharacterized membrane protein YphA (DoxX/SURF4 family)
MTATSVPTEASSNTSLSDPAVQAFWTLRIGFAALPILFGIDKFANVLTDNWTKYLSHDFNQLMPGSAATDMHLIGVVEIVAGIVVLIAPRLGGPLVAVWLAGIIVNLIDLGGYGDVAQRDLGLMVGAITLSRLAWALPGRLFGQLSR